MATSHPTKIKTHRDAQKRPCFVCCVTKAYCTKAFLFRDKAFFSPLVAYYYFMTLKVKKRDEEEREAIVKQLFDETSMVVSGEFDPETITYEELIKASSGPQEVNATWDPESLISAEDFEALRKEEEGDEDFEEEKPPKIKSWVYVLEEDTITELTQIMGEPLDNVLPPKLFYYGERILTHKNRDITVMVYVEILEPNEYDEPEGYKNELFSKYFGDTDKLLGKVYIHSQQHLPMMESASAVIDKEMEKMEVQDQVKEKKKKARVPRKKVQEAIEKVINAEPDSKEEQKALEELKVVLPSKSKKRAAPKKQLSAETLNKELPFAESESPKEPAPKRVKKTEEQKEAEKKAKEEAKAQKEAERQAKKEAKEAEKAKKAEEREAKKKEKTKKQE